jgi:hypothetical protein
MGLFGTASCASALTSPYFLVKHYQMISQKNGFTREAPKRRNCFLYYVGEEKKSGSSHSLNEVVYKEILPYSLIFKNMAAVTILSSEYIY